MLSLIAATSIAADQNASVDTAYFDAGIVCRSPSQTVPDRGALTASRQSKWADPLERRCYQQRRF